VCCSFTRHHCPCLVTRPRRLMLPHTVSSLSILRDRGGVDSQQAIQTMPPSTSATLMVVLTTHRSEGLARVSMASVTTSPSRLAALASREGNVLKFYMCSTYMLEPGGRAAFPGGAPAERPLPKTPARCTARIPDYPLRGRAPGPGGHRVQSIAIALRPPRLSAIPPA